MLDGDPRMNDTRSPEAMAEARLAIIREMQREMWHLMAVNLALTTERQWLDDKIRALRRAHRNCPQPVAIEGGVR